MPGCHDPNDYDINPTLEDGGALIDEALAIFMYLEQKNERYKEISQLLYDATLLVEDFECEDAEANRSKEKGNLN